MISREVTSFTYEFFQMRQHLKAYMIYRSLCPSDTELKSYSRSECQASQTIQKCQERQYISYSHHSYYGHHRYNGHHSYYGHYSYTIQFIGFRTGCPEKNDIGNYIFGEKSHLQKSYFYLFGRMHNLNLSQKI